MQSISEIIQTIARQRGRGDMQPLLSLTPIEGASSERISHLPIDADLAQAWVALTGEPFRPHQAHALTSLRRGEPVALRAASADVAMTAYLLLYATLVADPSATALVIVPDQMSLVAVRTRLARINQDLPRGLQLAATQPDPHRRPDHYARIVIATPDIMHSRLLRHHDRAWRLFWPQLKLVVLPEIQSYTGVAAAHLADLLTRTQRIAASHSGQLPSLLATLTDVVDAAPTLTGMIGHPWRLVPAGDGGHEPVTLAVWRGGTAWARDSTELAMAMQRQGYQVHIACPPIERALLAPIIDDLPQITFGPNMGTGQVLIVAGYPGSHSALRRMLRAGYRAVILVLGELPHEQALARHVATLLSDPASTWVAAPTNAYVLARHVLCAASELPLTEAEVEAWGARAIVDRLVGQGQLVDLPDPEVAWKPTSAAGDPYADFSLHSASGAAITASTEQGQFVDTIEPAAYERWAYPRAALPAGAGGFRVHERDEEHGTIALRLESNGRRTYPLRRCTIELRETHETRVMAGNRAIGWGRVVVSEEIYGFRESTAGSAPADIALKPTLNARWAAPACWFDLNIAVQVSGQFIGWSLAAALPLRALAALTDTVPCYDHEARRLYMVDAQPGGNGLAHWAYLHAEELLPLAYDIALACRSDPLLEPLSRVDMDWLLALLGRQAADAAVIERPRAAESPRPLELIAGPPPPQDERRPTSDERRPTIESRPATDERRTIIEQRPPIAQQPATTDDRTTANDQRRPSNDERRTTNAPPSPAPAGGRAGGTVVPGVRIPVPPDEQRTTNAPPSPAPAGGRAGGTAVPGVRASERLHSDAAVPALPPEQRRPPPAASPPRQPSQERRPEPPARVNPPQQDMFTPREPPQKPDERPARAPAAAPVPARAFSPPAAETPRAPQRPAAAPPPPTARPEPARPPADDAESPPDPNALIARLRRQRQQREAEQATIDARGGRRAQPAANNDADVERRFAAGERVFCLPYGDGVVRASRVEDGRELLTITFPTHGDLAIDPALSLVRKLEDAPQEEDDLL